MSAGGVLVGRPGPDRLDRMWTAATELMPTYEHLGSTLSGSDDLPHQRLRLGTGAADLARARDGLRAWVCHRGIGAAVHPAAPPLELGTTVLVALPLGPFTVVVPNRIVAVVDEPRRFGFAYGTLPGHQERGEESFVVEWCDDDSIVATISVDAVPATLPTRVGAPVVRWMQRRAISGYLAAWRSAVDPSAPTDGVIT